MIQFSGATAGPWKTLPSDRETSRSCARELCTSPLLCGNIFLCLSDVRPSSVRQVKKRFVHTFVFMDPSHCLHSQSGRNKTFKVCSVQWILRAKADPYSYHFTAASNFLPSPPQLNLQCRFRQKEPLTFLEKQ